MSAADDKADKIYWTAIESLYVTGDKAAFIKSCKQAEEAASDPELKAVYADIAATYQKEISSVK